MPKRNDVKKVLVIGSGPIIIGQAAEFDYAGTQACKALKEEGIEVVLVNSNPATIMTDTNIADYVYIEPLCCEILKKVIIKEKPDSILPTLGGQTGLNLAMELAESGFLDEQDVKLLGTATGAIKMAEDRQMFKDTMESIGEPCIASKVVNTVLDAVSFACEIGYPVIVRPAYTLGGTGGGIAYTPLQLQEICDNGLRLSRVTQVLIEKSIAGWKEIEYEVMRDSKGNVITVCNMENIDPVGIHTGDSIVVAPSQTLTDKEYQMLRSASLKIISTLKIEGGCNVQFALNPESFEYAVIEVNPRVSRSSALASKATGYPIAKVAAKIAIGYGLDEIRNAVTTKTFACFEPTLDYVVIKVPKWPFDKFVKARRSLGTQMKATGEVMAISSSFEGALLKAIRSLELGLSSLEISSFKHLHKDKILNKLKSVDDERIFLVAEGLRKGLTVSEINSITKIDEFFINKINNIVLMENELKATTFQSIPELLLIKAKKMGFTDDTISRFLGCEEFELTLKREDLKINATYKMVDTCAAEFEAVTPYYYSTFDKHCEANVTNNKKILIIGSGPIRIGQGIEFDYCSVHSAWALNQEGYETIIVNNNPETVSTDFDTSDRLYFEPITKEDVQNIVKIEKPYGAIVQFGGQTAIRMAKELVDMNVKIFGSQLNSIDTCEDREKFDVLLEKLDILRPRGKTIFTLDEAIDVANELGYPVLVRPSYVLGGQGMEIAYNDNDIRDFMEIIHRSRQEHPILVDKYLMGKEIEVDAICDGENILIPGIMEHMERAGIHSGDSISVYPTQTIDQKVKDLIIEYTKKLAKALDVIGLINIQFVLYNNLLYIIEVNPRSSRTVPYISKVTGIPMVNIATKIMMGKKINDFNYGTGLYKESKYVSVKVPVFSFEKLHDVDVSLGPEMKSTGEVLGIARTVSEALYKGILASNIKIPKKGEGILITVRDSDKLEILPIAEDLGLLGFILYATGNTAHTLNMHGIATNVVRKIGEGPNDIISLLESQKISLVINTPTKGRTPERDGFKIRRKAVEMSIPCLTSLDTAKALISCLKLAKDVQDIEIFDIAKIV